jgi:DNA-binding CsgD family transcriptional regulator
MARTLFFLEAMALLLASGLMSSLGAGALPSLLIPALVTILVPIMSVCAVWPVPTVARALAHAFSSERRRAGMGESTAVLGALVGFSGLGAVVGAIGAGIILLSSLSSGASYRAIAFQALAFILFGAFYGMMAMILARVVHQAEALPRNADAKEGLASFARKYGLSPRETEVAALIVDGRSYQETADSLFISIKTVKTHISRVYEKTACPNKVALVLLLRDETSESYKRPMAADPETGQS